MLKETCLVAKHQNKNLIRRIETLLVKTHDIWKDFGVGVAITIKNNNQYYTYRSTDRPAWPLPMAEIVSDVNFLRVGLMFTQEIVYPLPINLLSSDIDKKAAKRKASTQPRKVRLLENSA